MTYWEGKLFSGFPLASKRAILGSIAVCAGQGYAGFDLVHSRNVIALHRTGMKFDAADTAQVRQPEGRGRPTHLH